MVSQVVRDLGRDPELDRPGSGAGVVPARPEFRQEVDVAHGGGEDVICDGRGRADDGIAEMKPRLMSSQKE